MPRTFNGSSDRIRFSIGGLIGATGANTFVAVVNRASDTSFDSLIGLHSSGGTNTSYFQINPSDNVILGTLGGGEAASSFTALSSDGWLLLAATKANGDAVPRFHKYSYAANTISHQDGASSVANGPPPGSGGYMENTWQGSDRFHGDVAALAMFTGALSDAQIESLCYDFGQWYSYNPLAIWLFDQQSTSMSVPDLTGRGANQSILTGTSVSTASLPIITYGAPVMVPVALPPADTSPDASDDFSVSTEVASLFAPGLRWQVAIDWDGESLNPDVFTGATATGVGTPSDPEYLIATNSDADDVAIGKTVQLFDPDDVLAENAYFTVYYKNSAFGFTNLFYRPDSSVLAITGYQLRVVETGGFDEEHDDVTNRVLAAGDVTIEYGRDNNRSLSPMASGRAGFQLDNRSRDYSPDNVSSPLAGRVLPARPLRIQANIDGSTYVLFRGHYDDFDLRPNKFTSFNDVSGLDPLSKLRDAKISTRLHKGIRTGEALHKILDAMGWPAEKRDIDPGATTIRWWWEEKSDAFEAAQKLVNSEGPPALLHADELGRIVFRDRHHRQLLADSTSSHATFSPLTEPAYSDLAYDHGWRDVVNSVNITVRELDPGEAEVVWEDPSTKAIEQGTTLSVQVALDNPVIEPILTFDFVSGSSALYWIDQDSGQRLTWNVTAEGSDVQITNIKVTARPVTEQRTIEVNEVNEVSRDAYGQRDYPYDASWAGVNDAKAIAQILLDRYAERTPVVSITLRSGTRTSSTRLIQQLSRNLSDRIHITNDESSVDDDFFIDQIKHRILDAGFKLETEFTTERCPTDDISPMFIFDQAGHGFNDGKFAL